MKILFFFNCIHIEKEKIHNIFIFFYNKHFYTNLKIIENILKIIFKYLLKIKEYIKKHFYDSLRSKT